MHVQSIPAMAHAMIDRCVEKEKQALKSIRTAPIRKHLLFNGGLLF